LPFGPVEAQRAAQIRVDLEKRGQSIGPHDVLIAATAQANHSTLVTHNVAEFKRVEQLCIEDWF
jgi:tRNA(fMet)-specific endonuclease VapC